MNQIQMNKRIHELVPEYKVSNDFHYKSFTSKNKHIDEEVIINQLVITGKLSAQDAIILLKHSLRSY